MKNTLFDKPSRPMLLLLLLMGVLLPPVLMAQVHPYRGLWVGTVGLQAVNEVSIPLDEDNVPRAQDPRIPTPSFDRADVRLILHVNGAGQVSLLKDVAILNRKNPSDADVLTQSHARETDLALVTDPRVYADFPPQPALRIASAVFDFGDAKATDALDAIVAQATELVTDFVMDPGLTLDTQAQQIAAREDAVALLQPVLEDSIANADVASSFSTYIGTFPAVADSIAAGTADLPALRTDAESIRDRSFFADTRPIDVLDAVVAAVDAAAAGEEQEAARAMAASYADTENQYHRFISGQLFGDMVVAAASEAALLAASTGATEASIRTGIGEIPETIEALTRALQIKIQAFDDRRGEDAVDAVLDAMAAEAFNQAGLSQQEIRRRAEDAGRSTLAQWVSRYPLPRTAPTLDYNAFVTSSTFLAVPAAAAEAAAQAAVEERGTNPLHTELSVSSAATLAVRSALRQAYGEAARVLRTELPLRGTFGPGAGDPRLVRDLVQPTDLGAPGLEGRIYLPASAPTNPFRHRRHPDHGQGFDIERMVRLDFDGEAGDVLDSAGYGVEEISGTYREEIFGLHKPLGPEPFANPIGLRTEGRFVLQRISRIDTLHTR